MKDVIQSLGRLKRLHVLSIGTVSECRYEWEMNRIVRELSNDTAFLKAIGFSYNFSEMKDLAELSLLTGLRVLSIYQKYRDQAEQGDNNVGFDKLENIYYAASAFIFISEKMKEPPLMN